MATHYILAILSLPDDLPIVRAAVIESNDPITSDTLPNYQALLCNRLIIEYKGPTVKARQREGKNESKNEAIRLAKLKMVRWLHKQANAPSLEAFQETILTVRTSFASLVFHTFPVNPSNSEN